jgi:hypothetical protein
MDLVEQHDTPQRAIEMLGRQRQEEVALGARPQDVGVQ